MPHDYPAKVGNRRGEVWVRALRWLPAALLPFSVGALEAQAGVSGLPLMTVAAFLGCFISALLPQPRIAIFVTFSLTFLLVAASYVVELQGAEHSALKDVEALRLAPNLRHSLAARQQQEVVQPKIAGDVGSLSPVASIEQSGGAPVPVSMETMSIVLPCAFEGSYAWRTVDAIWQHTKHHRVKEILIVDDGSQPPLKGEFPERLLRGGPGVAPVRILRHEKTLGLIGAKKTGGDASVGDVIVFLDCHISPRDGWEDAFLKQMKRKGDHRTLVVPTITALDPDTWQEMENAPSSKACYLLWNADFTWLSDPGRDVPIMSGGLLALTRRWWQETGGLDEHMVAWGGENIDQSLRAWLCGGRIEVAEGAYIAHMWRDAKNPKTQLRYPIPSEDVMRNKARAVSAWLGPFVKKTMSFPEYEWFTSGKMSIGDMGNFDRLKARKTCAPFSSYIQRFSYVYIDSGLIPAEVFQLQEKHTGRCLERRPRTEMPHGVVLAPCAGGKDEGGTSETQLWHLGNRDLKKPGKACCSGLMNWNFIQCLDAPGIGMQVQTMECVIAGEAVNQAFGLADTSSEHAGQLTFRNGEGCVGPEAQKIADASRGTLGECSARVEPVSAEVVASSAGATAPKEFKLTSSGTPQACAQPGASSNGQGSVQFVACDGQDETQVFHATPLLDGFQIRVGETSECLDAGGGGQLLVYPCYEASAANANQVWQVRDGHLTWQNAGGEGYCIDMGRPAPQEHGGLQDELFFQSCAPKLGQRLTRDDIRPDGTFLFHDKDVDRCLSGHPNQNDLRMSACDEQQRWRWLKDREQVQHVASNWCLDAADEVKAILYPCHEPRAQRKQRFNVVDNPGYIFLMQGWEDNGRKRFFEKCLDHKPVPDAQVSVQKCTTQKKRGISWTRIGVRSSPEYEMWQQVPKPLPGALPLGGDAAPP